MSYVDLYPVTGGEHQDKKVVGAQKAIKAYSAALERQWLYSTGSSSKLYQSAVT
jgi:hypothetical protein